MAGKVSLKRKEVVILTERNLTISEVLYSYETSEIMHRGNIDSASLWVGWYLPIIQTIIGGGGCQYSQWQGLWFRETQAGWRDNEHKLGKEMFRLAIRESFFCLTAAQQCSSLPRDAVQSPILEVFKTRLDKTLSNRLSKVWPQKWPCCEQEVGLETSWAPFWPELSFECNWKIQKNCKSCLIVQHTSVRMNRLILISFSLRSF